MHGDARHIANRLDGEVSAGRIRCPGPGHSKQDRSMWVMLDWQAPDGFIVGSFAGDPFDRCRDYVRSKLGLPAWEPAQTQPDTDAGNPASSRGVEISPPDATEKRRSEFALALYRAGCTIRGTIGELYLKRRLGGEIPPCWDLRFHGCCPRGKERHPALVALLRDIRTNEPRAIQRIFLKPDGSDRLRDEMGKATLGPATGCVTKLTANAEVSLGLGVGEGIEKSLAVLATGWAPIWATCGTAMLSTFPVLQGIEQLTVFADHDPAGQRAARVCAQRWADAGRHAKIITPRIPGFDWNDALRCAA